MIAFLLWLLLATSAIAQTYPGPEPIVPTPPPGDNSKRVANTEWVTTALGTATGLPALANNKIWLGNATNVATAVTLSGDCTTTNAGVITCTATGSLPALGSALFWVGNGSNVATAISLNGDCTLSNAGAITCNPPRVSGVTFPASPPTHTVPVITGSNTATYKAVPNCLDTTGNHLNYNQTSDTWICGNTSSATALTWNFIGGLTLSNDGAAPITTLDIAAGAANDSTNSLSMRLLTPFTKLIKTQGGTACTSTFFAGSGNCGMIAAAVADTWYHVFLITIGGNADIYFDTSVIAANAPVGTTSFRRIGSIRTNAGIGITGFVQHGDEFWWKATQLDQSNVAVGAAAVPMTLAHVPLGIQTQAIFNANVINLSAADFLYFSALEVNDEAASDTAAPLYQIGEGGGGITSWQFGQQLRIWTNTARQIRARAGIGVNVYVATVGWVDLRGK